MKSFKFLIILAVYISSCKRNGQGFITGTVTENGANKPVPGIKVTLKAWKRERADVPEEYNIISTTSTDNDGQYKMSLYKKSGYNYKISCEGNKSYLAKNQEYDVTVKKSSHNFSLDPCGYIKIRLKKTSFSGNYFFAKIGDNYNEYFRPYNPYDTLLPMVYPVVGNTKTIIAWSVYKKEGDPDPAVHQPEEVFVKTGDTAIVSFQID